MVFFPWVIGIIQRANEIMVTAFYLLEHDWEIALAWLHFLQGHGGLWNLHPFSF